MKKTSKVILLLYLSALILSILPDLAFPQEEKTIGLAVMRLRATGISETEAETLTETLHTGISRLITERGAALKEKYTLLERSEMDKILDNFQFQDTGCTDDKCAVELGKMLAVSRIIVGSVGLVGSTYSISGRLVDVESSKVIRSVTRTYKGEVDNILFIIPLVGEELLTGYRPPDPANISGVKPNASISPSSPPVTTQAGGSYLSIEGLPSSAGVSIDGQSIGTAPIQFHSLAPGKHAVLVASAGYEKFSREIVIEPEKRHKLSYALVPLAKITVRGDPSGAVITVDGKEIGASPITGRETPKGVYTVKVSLEGYTSFEEKVTVSPGESKEVIYTLKKLVVLSLECIPAGAEITIDGEPAGITPLSNQRIVEGDHEIVLRLAGYETHRQTIFVSASGSPLAPVALIPKDRGKILLKSVIFPGSGQFYAEHRGKGKFIGIVQAVAAVGAVATSLLAMKANDDYDAALVDYQSITSQTEAGRVTDARAKVDDTYNKSSDAATLQIAFLAAAAAVYAYNVIDATLTRPTFDTKPSSNALRIEPNIEKNIYGVNLAVRF